jgi:hypothetical protein
MAKPLEGIRRKLQRAIDHLDELDKRASDFLATEPYRLTNEFDPADECYVTRFRIEREPPIDLGIVAGEAIQQFRSTLDHLALRLARLHRPTVDTATFPIYTDRKVYTTKLGAKNRSPQDVCRRTFRPEDLTRIEGMQPYLHAVPANSGLAILQRLSNVDKHAVIHTPFANRTRASIPANIFICRAELRLGPIEDRTEIARWRPLRHDVQVNWQVGVGIGYGSEGFMVESLRQLGIGVIGIVDEFEEAIPDFRPT